MSDEAVRMILNHFTATITGLAIGSVLFLLYDSGKWKFWRWWK